MITKDLIITSLDMMFLFIVGKAALMKHNFWLAGIVCILMLILVYRFAKRSQ